MTSGSGRHNKENRGHCSACRKTYHWLGEPVLREALCPKHATPLELLRTGRARQRGEAVNIRPLAQARPELVVREVATHDEVALDAELERLGAYDVAGIS